jgi:hypothetical protein
MSRRSRALLICVCAGFVALPSFAAAQSLSFAGRRDVLVGESPQGIAAGDFNRDGRRDLAVANDVSNSVTIALASADGAYRPLPAIAVGANPRSIAVGRFNGDNVDDLAVAEFGGASVSILLGAGDGTFTIATALAVGISPASVASGLFNNDALADLAIANSGSHTVSVLFGQGNGTFTTGPILPAGLNPTFVTVGQLDADATVDIAVANAGSGNISVMLGNGDGTFQSALTFATGENPRGIARSDFNRDGRPDLAVANLTAGSVAILLGHAVTTFASGGSVTVDGASSVAAADLNLDNAPDLIVTLGRSTGVSVALGNGSGGFGAATPYGTGTNPTGVIAEDFNGDNRPDVATVNMTSDTASVLLGNGDGTLRATPTFAAPGGPVFVAVGDFNHDSIRDLATSNYDAGTLSVLRGNANGTYGPPTIYAVGPIPWAMVAVDLNQDSHIDLAVGLAGADFVAVFQGNGDGTFRPPVNYTVGSSPQGLAAGDVNADGRIDLVAANVNQSSVSVLLGVGDGTFQTPRHFLANTGPSTVALGDFNGDTRVDLVVGNYYVDTVSILLGSGDGNFGAPQAFTIGNGPLMVATGDFNGDGALDVAAANYQRTLPSTVSVLLGNGNGTLGQLRSYPTGIGPASIAVADLDGDGKQDLAAPNYGSNSVPALYVSVLLGNGDGTHRAPLNFGAGSGAIFVAIDDLNRDTKPDIISANYGASTVSVLLNDAIRQETTAAPTFTPDAGTYVESVTVAIASATAGARIHFTTDGSAPSTSSPLYSSPIRLTASTTIRAIAAAPGLLDSAATSASYTLRVAAPTFTPPGGTFNNTVTVSISTTTPGASIRYTTDGSPASPTSPLYTGPITIGGTTTIRAIATASGMSPSAESTAAYTHQSAPPTEPPQFAPAPGPYVGSVAVTLTTATSGAVIYYTTDGSTPTRSSTVYSGPILVTRTTTITAIAELDGSAPSNPVAATYTIQALPPSFSPPGGTFSGSVLVTLSTSTADATIRYTTDGSAPTSSSPAYAGPISITQTTTIRAITTASGMANSTVASATYTLQALPPSFSPPAGTFIGSVQVTVSTSTAGATIRYTTDGSTPTASSPAYTGPISITQTTTVRAITTAPAMADSTAASATYTIEAIPPSFSPPGGTFNQPLQVTLTTPTSGATIRYTTDGSTPTASSPAYTGPISITRTTTVRAMTTAPGNTNSAVASATYTLQTAAPTFSPPGGSYVLPQFVSISSSSPGAAIYYTTDGSTPTTSSTRYTGSILLASTTTVRAIAVVTGWSASTVSSATYTFLLP